MGTRITPESQLKVQALIDKVGPQRAASILGTRTRQVERWAKGTGQTTRSDSQRIGVRTSGRRIAELENITEQRERRATYVRKWKPPSKRQQLLRPASAKRPAEPSEYKTRQLMKRIAASKPTDSRRRKREIMELAWDVGGDDLAASLYEELYG